MEVDAISIQIDASAYKSITVFIDPIDGTREFSTGDTIVNTIFLYLTFMIGLGEQCSICVGFSNSIGRPVAGLVYRPIPQPPTWAAGSPTEQWVESELDMAVTPNPRGFLTSNGGISKFIETLVRFKYNYLCLVSYFF